MDTGMFTYKQLYNASSKRKTLSLFQQTCVADFKPILSLTSNPDCPLPSLRNLFIKYVVDDPTEATFALIVFGDVRFWGNMQNTKVLKGYFEEYRKTTDILRKSEAFKLMTEEVTSRGKNSYQAAKFLIDEPWKKGKVERTKSKLSTQEAFSSPTITQDLKRLREKGYLQ